MINNTRAFDSMNNSAKMFDRDCKPNSKHFSQFAFFQLTLLEWVLTNKLFG